MATYGDDRITITGPGEDIDEFIKTCTSESLILDGGKIVPYPEHLRVATDGALEAERAIWRRENWGCAALSEGTPIERIGPTRVRGEITTPRGSPEELFFIVSRRFPRLIIEDIWCAEGYYGSMVLLNGAVIHEASGNEDVEYHKPVPCSQCRQPLTRCSVSGKDLCYEMPAWRCDACAREWQDVENKPGVDLTAAGAAGIEISDLVDTHNTWRSVPRPKLGEDGGLRF